MSDSYNASSLDILSGLEPVQKRPGMYTDTASPHHLAWEVIDNSIDEALAGHADRIEVALFTDNALSVQDNGRGMPVDQHREAKLSGVELILTTLHAGSKFSDKHYQFAGGLHGVGVSVVNALSSQLEVTIERGGHRHSMSFAHGQKQTELKKIGKIPKHQHGTCVKFWPDASYFDDHRFRSEVIAKQLQTKAALCPGITLVFFDHHSGQEQTWCYQGGLATYLQERVDEAMLPQPVWQDTIQEASFALDWAMGWTEESTHRVGHSFVNLIPTAQGGTHVQGMRQGLLDAVREFCQYRKLLPKSLKIQADDVMHHLQFILSLKIKEPQFQGQTKEKLTSQSAKNLTSNTLKDAFSLWLHQHVDAGEAIARIIIDTATRRINSQRAVQRKKVTSGPALPGKLADCVSTDFVKTELFLVEGDSAGGSAKQARQKDHQAIMPLTGKILNTWETSVDAMMKSQDIQDIIVAMGVKPQSSDLTGLRYGKICVLADADSDGQHIATLLCALFVKHFQPLVQAGHVYIALPPLYRIDIGKTVFYALDDQEKDAILAKHEAKQRSVSIQRFKGLGEMNPLQLRETTMDPTSRRLIQLTLEDQATALSMMDKLLGKKRAADRKAWLEQKGHMAQNS